MAGPYRLEVWDTTGATREAILGWGTDIVSAKETEELNGKHSLQLTVRRDSEKWDYLSGRKLIRRQNLADSGDYIFFRIQKPKEGMGSDGAPTATISATHWAIADLGAIMYKNKTNFIQANSKALVNDILSGSGWSRDGTWPTDNIDFEVDFDSILEILRKVCEQLGKDLDLNAGTKTVNATDLGSATDAVLRFGKQIIGDEKSIDYPSAVTRVVPVGGGEPTLTIARSQLEVQGVATVTVTVDPYCIPSDDSHIGDYITFDTGTLAGNSYAITDSATGASTHSITTATNLAAAGAAAGDKIRITDSAGTGLTYIDDKSAQDDYGVIEHPFEAEYPPVENLILNGAMYCDGAASCPDWTKTDAGAVTLAKNETLDYIKYGEHSLRVQTTSEDEGIYQAITFDTDKQYSLSLWVYVSSGVCRLEVKDGAAPDRWHPPEDRVLKTTTTGWIQLKLEGITPDNASCQVRVVQEGATNSDFYVDSILVTETASTPTEFTEDRTATRLRREAYAWQRERYDPEISYRVKAQTLALIAPNRWRYEGWVLGDTLRLIDERLSLDVDLRVKQISWDVQECAVQDMVFDNVRHGLGSRIADLYDRNRRRRQADKDARAAAQAEEIIRGDHQRWTTQNEAGEILSKEYLMTEHPRIIYAGEHKHDDTIAAMSGGFVVPVGRQWLISAQARNTLDTGGGGDVYTTKVVQRWDYSSWLANYGGAGANSDHVESFWLQNVGVANHRTAIPAGTYTGNFNVHWYLVTMTVGNGETFVPCNYLEGIIMILEVPA